MHVYEVGSSTLHFVIVVMKIKFEANYYNQEMGEGRGQVGPLLSLNKL